MQFQGSVIKEQGITFAVVIVKKHIIDNRPRANEMIRTFAPVFGNVPVVLMAQNSRGTPTYYGRKDISKFMAKVPLRAIPWKKYTLN